MDLRKLEYIIAIAEEKSLSKAAEKLFITQSALSQLLSTLKAEGIPPLFSYHKREMHLTDVGKIYVNSARTIIEIEKDARAALQDLSVGRIQTFQIAVSPHLSLPLYLNVLPRLRQKFPNTGIHCSPLEERYTTAVLESGKADLAFHLSLYDTSKFVHYTVLKQEELVMVSLPGCVTKNTSFVLPQTGSGLRMICNQAFEQNGMRLNIYAESNDIPLALSLTRRGECNTVLPRNSVMDPDFELHSFPQPCYFYLVASYRKNFWSPVLDTAIHMMEDYL